MKKLSALLLISGFVFGCVTTPTLKDYKAKNADEAEIVSLFQTMVDSVFVSYDSKKFMSLFAPELKMTTANLKSVDPITIDRAAAIPFWEKRINLYKGWQMKAKAGSPLLLEIEGNQAEAVFPYKLWTRKTYQYWELGRIHLKLRKTDSGWLISNYKWDLVDCNHSTYDREAWEERRKKFLPAKWVNDYSHPFTASYPLNP